MSVQEKSPNVTLGLTRKSLEATIIRACRKCGAPGVASSSDYVKANWPGCYDPSVLPGYSRPVGDICPNCQARRPRNEDQGELAASMPKWLWRLVLGFKWCLIQVKTIATTSTRRLS